MSNKKAVKSFKDPGKSQLVFDFNILLVEIKDKAPGQGQRLALVLCYV
ncbi:MAG: hypothetical protein HOG03_04600 [Desulfobacula sp.]|nr:hypothetical protein [Desulfobacula sp.]MBT3483953.1 hypothetical protein [Desulfobacula sp.]MBT3803860.1 hypothetical protein [Desulfobacula sp.]MBT4023805.1 hypothetical protein [Desulfobacula sp.]MBT4197635.1 hypothetical protein [Desulfobacula sp.]